MNAPLVTIGIPCYNVGKFIRYSIKSVLCQTYQNFELIITDDGSTDDTLNVIRQFKDERIVIVADGENHGISYRLNQQISMAKGDFFVRMDGDDIMFPDRIEKEIEYLIVHPELDIVGSHAVIIDDSNHIIGYRGDSSDTIDTVKAIKSSVFIHPTVAGRMEFFRKYLYDETLCGVEDKDLWFRGLVGGGKYQIIDDPLMFYRDPLQFKLSTYLYRQKVSRIQINKRWNLIIDKNAAVRCFVGTYFRSFMAFLAVVLSIDDKFIRRRNMQCPSIEKYESVLESLI